LIYEIEAKLWTWAAKDRRWMDSLPQIKSILARPDGEASVRNPFYKWANQFEELLDSKIPYPDRLRNAGELFQATESLVSIDKQILALSCLARFLARNRSYDFAALVRGRLQQLSVSISAGMRQDCTGLVLDLLDEPWFPSSRQHPSKVA
jgi:hypothetical protein